LVQYITKGIMTTKKEVVIALVPGSFATTVMYDRVVPLLEKAGYKTHGIELLSANDGTIQPSVQMVDDAAEIKKQLLTILDSGKNVVLALQSYGGIPGSEACKGLSQKDRGEGNTAVIGILYAASFIPAENESVRSIMDAYIPDFYKTGIPGGYFDKLAPEMAALTFNDLEDKEAALKYGASMTGHSSDTYSGRASYAAWRDIPGTTIIPQLDVIVATAEQEKMYDRAKAAGAIIKRVPAEGGGHAITVTQPQLVADELIKLAEA
jgi:pimeloyl-ACP methyl ester carboxylesterase